MCLIMRHVKKSSAISFFKEKAAVTKQVTESHRNEGTQTAFSVVLG